MKFKTMVEVRHRGAIGVFTWASVITEGATLEEAKEKVWALMEEQNLETRGFCTHELDLDGRLLEPFLAGVGIPEFGTMFEGVVGI